MPCLGAKLVISQGRRALSGAKNRRLSGSRTLIEVKIRRLSGLRTLCRVKIRRLPGVADPVWSKNSSFIREGRPCLDL